MSTLLLVIRLLLLAQLLYVSVHFTVRTLVSFAAVVVVFYFTQERRPQSAADNGGTSSRARGGEQEGEETSVPGEVTHIYQRHIARFVLFTIGYDPECSPLLERFMPVQQGTECIFAKAAKLWGAREWDERFSLEENVQRSIPALIKFLAIGHHSQLDGFLFELPCAEYGGCPESFGRGVRSLLSCLSEADPAGVHCLRRSYIGGRGWFFEFADTSIFITTFAPFYSTDHSRHSFGVDGCFVLLQPEYSFAAKNLSEDTPVTNWDNPQTVRDRIRVAYRKAGREYLIRDTIYYSPALDTVKPLSPKSEGEIVEWWKE